MSDNSATESRKGPGVSPYDTGASSSLRFLVEVIAWVAGPWAVADSTGQSWLAVPTAVLLVGMSSIFSTTGDKNNVVVPTPGPLRLTIELFTMVVAVAGAWIVWPLWAALLVTAAAVGNLVAGLQRSRWLASGAPLVE